MTTSCADRKQIDASALVSHAQTTRLENALRSSAKLDAADRREVAVRAGIRQDLFDLTSQVVDSFQLFCEWRVGCERSWSFHPETYSHAEHLDLKGFEGTWFDIHRRVVKMLDWFEQLGEKCPHSDTIRQRYAIMLSVELMDTGEMPPAIVDATRAAIQARERGEAV